MRRGLVLALVCGCSLPRVDLEGQHVRLAADPGLEPCGGTLAHMDAFVARLAEEFGVAPPTGNDRIKYFWLEHDEFSTRSGCPANSRGCAKGKRKVSSYSAPLDHELVHALAARRGGAPPFFGEGLATAFQGLETGLTSGWPNTASPEILRTMMTVTTPDQVSYGVAGSFIHVLVQSHGAEAVLAMIAQLPRETSLAEIEGAFQTKLGVTLADSIVAFTEFTSACPEDNTAMLLECEAPEIAWDGREIVEFRDVGCEQEDVIGPYDGNAMQVMRTIAVPEDGVYEVRVIGDGMGLALVDCGGCGVRAKLGDVGLLELTAGLYSLRLIGSLDAIEVGWTIRRVD